MAKPQDRKSDNKQPENKADANEGQPAAGNGATNGNGASTAPKITPEDEVKMFERLDKATNAFDTAMATAESKRPAMVAAYGEIYEKLGAGPWLMSDGTQCMIGRRVIKGSNPEKYNYFRKSEIPQARRPGERPQTSEDDAG